MTDLYWFRRQAVMFLQHNVFLDFCAYVHENTEGASHEDICIIVSELHASNSGSDALIRLCNLIQIDAETINKVILALPQLSGDFINKVYYDNKDLT